MVYGLLKDVKGSQQSRPRFFP